MNWFKAIEWTHFVTVLKDTIDELKKSINQHTSELQQLHQQNQMLLQLLGQQKNEILRLERKLESIEMHLRIPVPSSPNMDGMLNQQSKLPSPSQEA